MAKPTVGQTGWGGVLNDHLTGMETDIAARQVAADLEADVAAKVGTAGALDTALSASYGRSAELLRVPARIDPARISGAPAAAALDIATFDGGGEATHPSVIDFGAKPWNGYRYWMALTPYGGTDSSIECPSIYCSHDGDTWVVPTGLTNPIEADPVGTDFNSDTHLVYMPEDDRLYCLFRQGGSAQKVYYRASSDGVDWSDRAEVFDIGFDGEISHSVLWDGEQWVMWSISAPSGAGNNVLRRRTAPTLTGPWSAYTVCTGLTLPAGREMWHSFVTSHGGQFYALIDDAPDAEQGTDGDLYFAVSDDGLAWDIGTSPAVPHAAWYDGIYRSCMTVAMIDGRFAFDCWYAPVAGAATTGTPGGVWKIARTSLFARDVGDPAGTSYTPTITSTGGGLVVGAGATIQGRYVQSGKWVKGWVGIVFGTTDFAPGAAGAYEITLPVTARVASIGAPAQHGVVGTCRLQDAGVRFYSGTAFLPDNGDGMKVRMTVEGGGQVGPTVPMTFAQTDRIYVEFNYETA